MQRIYSVCWNITEKCNENCRFCYRTLSPDLSLEENILIADKLIEYGVEKITFSGGEPLLYKNLIKLAKYIKEKNPSMILSLTTNGMLINESTAKKIIELFDWITFDIDSPSEEYHINVGRGRNHLRKNIENIKLFSGKIKIKVNTVVTKQNLKYIFLIWNILRNFDIKRWKLFRFYPINYQAIQNEDEFSITDTEFKDIISTIKNLEDIDRKGNKFRLRALAR